MQVKRCPKCGQTFPLDSFGKRKASKDGLQPICRKCVSLCYKKYRKTEQGRAKIRRQQKKYGRSKQGRESSRRTRIKYVYGLTLEQHKQIYLNQNGCCKLCGDSVAYTKIYTDHNHVTGKVRGFLCHRCNTGIGFLGDTVEGLQKAVKYLKGN